MTSGAELSTPFFFNGRDSTKVAAALRMEDAGKPFTFL